MERNADDQKELGLPTIRAKLSMVVLACVVPSLIGLGLLIFHFYARERAQLERDVLQTARALAQAIDRDLATGKAAALALATSGSLQSRDIAAFRASTEKVLVNDFPGAAFVLSDENGDQLVNTFFPLGAALPRNGNLDQVRPIFVTGKPAISDIFIDRVSQRPEVSIDVPVWQNGKVAYVLSVILLPERLGGILNEQRLPPDWIVAIYDSQGRIAARSHQPEKFIGQRGASAVLNLLQQMDEGFSPMNTLEGIPIYSAFSRSAVSRWAVAIGIPRQAFLMDLLLSTAIIALIVVGVMAAGFGMAWRLGGRIGQSVRALTAPALDLGAGKPFVFPPCDFREAVEVARALKTVDGELTHRLTTLLQQRDELKTKNVELHWLHEAVRQSSAALLVTDCDHRIQFANPAYVQLFGYSLDDLLGSNQSVLLPDDPALRDANPIESGYFEGEKLRRTKDGRVIPVLVKSAPITDADGATIGYVSAKTDLTDLKQAQMLAEAANRAKSTFLATMSHEIRTPMNGIIGMAHLAQRGDLPPKSREYVESIGAAAQRLMAIINSILDFSKIESGMMASEAVEFHLDDFLTETLAQVNSLAVTKGLDLSVAVAPEVPQSLIGDPLRIGQMLLNYLSNAIKFSERGTIAVTISVEDVVADAACLRVAVSDTGVGIAPDHLSHLFLPFLQADATITRRFGGSGLGLAIVKELAHLMGGEVGAESVVGQGSTFWFTVKVGLVSGGPAVADAGSRGWQKVVPRGGAHPADYALLRGVLVLLVEDDPTNQNVAIGLLEAAGMTVHLARDGAVAIEMVEANDYEIVLMDMQMPVMDGLTATRRIREMGNYAELPIVAMTANAMRRDKEKCLAAGMNDFISKPFNPSQLYTVILEWVTGLRADVFSAEALRRFDESDVDLPLEIPGLDVRAGLRVMAGMKGLYIKTLRNFLAQYENDDTAARLRSFVASGDIDTAGRLIHTVKGAFASIGANEIRHITEAIEEALGTAEPAANALPLVDRLEIKLAALLEALTAAIPARPTDMATAASGFR